jgi:hypothetical protein
MLDNEILQDALKRGAISERKLKTLSVLKTCDNWKKVVPIGLIDHRTVLTTYQGVLVELDKRVYFVRKETMIALKGQITWRVTRQIRIDQ